LLGQLLSHPDVIKMAKLRDIKEIMQRIDIADMMDEIGDVDDDSMMIEPDVYNEIQKEKCRVCALRWDISNLRRSLIVIDLREWQRKKRKGACIFCTTRT
jgi:hypothetical protein